MLLDNEEAPSLKAITYTVSLSPKCHTNTTQTHVPSLSTCALILLHFPYTSTRPHRGLSTGNPDQPFPTCLPSTKKWSSPVCVTRQPTVCPSRRRVRSANLFLFFLCLRVEPQSSQWHGEVSRGREMALLGITLYSAGLMVVNPMP